MAPQTRQQSFPTPFIDVPGSGVETKVPPPMSSRRSESETSADRPLIEKTRESVEPVALLAGRAVFGGYFLYNAWNHFWNYQPLAQYAQSKGVRYPHLAVAGSGLMLLAGGVSILTGAWPKLGAGMISAFLAGVSPQMHAFWNERDGQRRQNEMVNFMKNMALIGATFLTAAEPEPWPVSVAPTGELAPR